MMDVPKFMSGAIVPMFTPFEADGSIDLDGIHSFTEWLLSKPLNALFPLGGTGEWIHLSFEEKKLVNSAVLRSANGRMPVMPGVHGDSLDETIELAKFTEDQGADAITVVVPKFVEAKEDDLFRYYEVVARSVQLPVFLYDPGDPKRNISPQLLNRLTQIENIVGIKDSSRDIKKLMRHVIAANGKVAVIQGDEELYLPGLSVGAIGTIGGGCNVYPEFIAAIRDAFDDGDLSKALDLQRRVCQLLKTVSQGWPAFGKRILRSFGVQINETCRTNHGPINEKIEDDLKSLLNFSEI